MRKMQIMLVIMFGATFSAHAATLIDFDFTGLPINNLGPLTATDVIADHVVLADPGLSPGGTTGLSPSNSEAGEFNWWQFNLETGATGTGGAVLQDHVVDKPRHVVDIAPSNRPVGGRS